ncbi:hypothetical protein [Pseudaestuariivita sp.]|uniref:hypothetical protein n=1 Tax=Pseudaestuariivita sp. TaxID=2211669 RepID=UPI0040594D41
MAGTLPVWPSGLFPEDLPLWLKLAIAAVLASPAVCVLLAVAFACGLCLPKAVAYLLKTLILVVFCLSYLLANFSGQSRPHSLLMSLTVAVCAWQLVTLMGPPASTALPAVLLALSGLAGAGSLARAGVVVFNAQHLADGRPYCIASNLRQGSEVTAWSDLRFSRFNTGGSDGGFHGILLVEDTEAYNWSMRQVAFDRLYAPYVPRPDALPCTPVPDFPGTTDLRRWRR